MPMISAHDSFVVFGASGNYVGLRYPKSLEDALAPFLEPYAAKHQQEVRKILHVIAKNQENFCLVHDGRILSNNIKFSHIIHIAYEEISILLGTNHTDTAIRASAIMIDHHAIVILGAPGCGKSRLAAWFLNAGFRFLADDFVSLATRHVNHHGGTSATAPIAMPLAPHASVVPEILEGGSCRQAPTIESAGRLYIAVEPSTREDATIPCALVIVPQFSRGSELEIEPRSFGELQFHLKQALHPAQRLTDRNLRRISRFARAVPMVSVRFGSPDQLVGELDRFVSAGLEYGISPSNLWSFCHERGTRQVSSQQTETSPKTTGIQPPTATVARYRKRLTVGMATYDDFDGVYFSIQALRLYHPEIIDDIELLVIDNNPDGECGPFLKQFEKQFPNYRYIPAREHTGTAVRNRVISEAASEYVLNLDCHVFLVPGALDRLVRYFESNPHTSDLIQGPLIADSLTKVATHMDPVWHRGMYGQWGQDERGFDPEAPPFEIPMHGLGLFACRRAAWPGFNSQFQGFGGEEGYIHEKFRRAGARVMCLPFLRWLHRFDRPQGVPYDINWKDRVNNYVIGFQEVGLPTEPVFEHFKEFLGPSANAMLEEARSKLANHVPAQIEAEYGATPR